ncbi:MAG: hypothetical protein V7741_00200 [Hyphomonas sp.]
MTDTNTQTDAKDYTIRQYAEFVDRTDVFKDLSDRVRRRVAVYGLASEVGSVVSAVKKERLKSGDALNSRLARDELRDEIGDVIWYCFVLARIEGVTSSGDILTLQIKTLVDELQADDERGALFRERIGPEKQKAFLEGAADYPHQTGRNFDGFQTLAFNTARTEGETLLDVCLAVLTQLAAQLMRIFLTKEELELNDHVKDRSILVVLGEVAWHLAALATLYNLKLSDIVQRNREKLENRQPGTEPTPLPDADSKEKERFPRQFEVQFVTVGKGRSRMYWNGRQLGDDLTDNAEPDGYRFHDVLHLAHIAHLGWSPVVRSFMGRKRKSDEKIDEIQDGGRARVVEETIIKMVHSEGLRIAEIRSPGVPRESLRLFEQKSDVSHNLLCQIEMFTDGLEPSANRHWEWTEAIMDGFEVYWHLVRTGQGTVFVDMEKRTLTFSPHVHLNIPGAVTGFGQAVEEAAQVESGPPASYRLMKTEKNELQSHAEAASHDAAKSAILSAAGFDPGDTERQMELELHLLDGGQYSVRAQGEVQQRFWDLGVISVRIAKTRNQNSVYCSALLIADGRSA